MSHYAEPQGASHPTIRMGLIGPFALIHPIHSPTRASLTPAGDFLQAYDDMDVFGSSPLSLSRPEHKPIAGHDMFSAARLHKPRPYPSPRPDPTHPRPGGGGVYEFSPKPEMEPRPDLTFPRPPEPVV